ncbi:RNA polymerase sigma-54 factor RpoN, partial [hydrothermal vent metagenome]
MKQTLQLRLGQHLTMTPQLQQAIRLLQLSTLELETEVQGILDSNLMLEREENEAPTESEAGSATAAQETKGDTNSDTLDVSETEVGTNTENLPEDLPVDTQWEDTYDMGATTYSAPAEGDNRDYFETHAGDSESLQEHLSWQLDLTPFSDEDHVIA